MPERQTREQIEAAILRLARIRAERDWLAARRHDLWRQLSEAPDAPTARRADAISRRLVELEDEGRALRASVRFGSRKEILGRARMELTVVRGLGDN